MPPASTELSGVLPHRGHVRLVDSGQNSSLQHLLTGDVVQLSGLHTLRFASNGAAYIVNNDSGAKQWVHPLLPHSLHTGPHEHFWRRNMNTQEISKTVRRGTAAARYPELPFVP
eukprot:6483635-Amphidinium_carterae.1